MSYQPADEILRKYADVLVNFALGGGKGLKAGEVVFVQCPLSALPLYRALRKAVVDAGGHMLGNLADDMSGAARYFYQNANQSQLTKFHDKYYKGLVDQIDHRVAILADWNPHELDGVDPKKIMLSQKSAKPMIEWLNEKEQKGKYTWTLALYGTPAMAKEARMSEQEYWQQIIHACYLDHKNPIIEWRNIFREIKRVAKQLSDLKMEKLRINGQDVDLELAIGKDRRWLGGGGRNIPSFEIFTSPDWRDTKGWIRFNMPLYRFGNLVEGIELHFEKGRVVKATATKNQKLLREMLKTDDGASQVGEISLTDKRLSRITKFMAETLYDENIGGRYGNTHLAVGRSYLETYNGDASKLTKARAAKLGYNESVIHTDMFSTTDRVATATLADGSQKVIYEGGRFTI